MLSVSTSSHICRASSSHHLIHLIDLPLNRLSLNPIISPVGLLKNLSIPTANKTLLGQIDLIQKLLVDMACLAEERDVVGSIQGGAVGIVKNLCRGNAHNSALLVLGSPLPSPSGTSSDEASLLSGSTSPSSSPLEPLLAFISRTDDLPLRIEATRALSAAIRSLYLSSPSPTSNSSSLPSRLSTSPANIKSARHALGSNDAVVEALMRMVRDALGEEEKGAKAEGASASGIGGRRFEVVLVEGIVGLVLIASSPDVNVGGSEDREAGKLSFPYRIRLPSHLGRKKARFQDADPVCNLIV